MNPDGHLNRWFVKNFGCEVRTRNYTRMLINHFGDLRGSKATRTKFICRCNGSGNEIIHYIPWCQYGFKPLKRKKAVEKTQRMSSSLPLKVQELEEANSDVEENPVYKRYASKID